MFSYFRHIGDYAKKAGHLSTFEHGIYTLLLDHYYDKESPIEDWRAHRIARCSREEAEPVLREFFAFDEATKCWHNARADEEIAAYHARGEISRRNGALGGRPKGPVKKSEKPKTTEKTQSKPAKKAAVSKRPKPGSEAYSDGFIGFWDAYPSGKRSKKLEAWKVWYRDELEEFASAIVKDIERRKSEHWGWLKENGAFIPGAQVYLNGRRWNDDIEPPPRGGGGGRRSTTEQANAERAGTWANGGKQE
jgi:uncharacterized protein YdaU (DUF1376 family)